MRRENVRKQKFLIEYVRNKISITVTTCLAKSKSQNVRKLEIGENKYIHSPKNKRLERTRT